jgi:hypothetical protein
MENEDLKSIAIDIINNKNNEHSWLNIKLSKINRIDNIDKKNDYYIKPNDCRWWFGDTKRKRYNNLCKKVCRGNRKRLQIILEHIHNIRKNVDLFIPEHPNVNYKFEKSAAKPGFYELCKNGIILKKNDDVILEDCPICYELIQDKNYFVTACCGKKFCGTCIFKHYSNNVLFNTSCPLCRQTFVNIEVPTIISPIRVSRSPSEDFNNIETPNINIQRQNTIYNDFDITAYINNVENNVENMEQEISTIIENNFNDMMTPTYIPERSLYYTYDNLADVPNYATTHQIGQIEVNNPSILHYGLGS